MGPIHAELVRDLVSRMSSAQWRFALTDADGRFLHTGLISARPGGRSRRAASSRGIVELQVRDRDLDILKEGDDGARWASVVDDIARTHRAWLTGAVSAGGGVGAAGSEDAPHRRAPGAALRRLLEARDGRCFFMGCRAPATAAQIDHTIRWTDHGPTREPNLGAGCTHDHRLKDEGGWRVTQPEPGHFRWTSRLGHHYHRTRALIIEPMPEPHDRDIRDARPTAHPDSDPERMLVEDLQHHLVRLPRPPPELQDPPF
jgi:hypothetical protein